MRKTSRPHVRLAKNLVSGESNDEIPINDMQQTYDYDCGAKTLNAVFAYYGVEVQEGELISELGTNTNEGTRIADMIRVAKNNGFNVSSGKTNLASLKRIVDAGYPVVILIQAWIGRKLTLDEWREEYGAGHYCAVIDFEEGKVIFEDPWVSYRVWLTEEEFEARWHANADSGGKADHWAMVLSGKKPRDNRYRHMG